MPRRCGRPARSAVVTVTVTVTVTAAARRPWSPPRGTGVTAFPAAEADAASFDTGLVQRYGAEQIGKGHNVALSPAINILRVPYWDRAAETFGADPYLTSQMAVAEVKGLRQRGAPPRPGAVP
jgi:beta-glucosidase-like glycosyl hydrolase